MGLIPGPGTSFVVFFLSFLGSHLQHRKFPPRLRIELELQTPAYTTATATPDPGHICKLHRSAQQRQILNPLIKARD